MKFSIQQTQIKKLIHQRNRSVIMAGALITILLMQSLIIFCLIGRDRIIISPPVLKNEFWVSRQAVSPDYLAEMTEFFSTLRFNITSASVDYQNESLLRYADPAYYGALKNELNSMAEYIKKENISTVFYPVSVEVGDHELQVIVTGDFSSYVGKVKLRTQRVAYRVSYHYQNGRLLIEEFKEVKRDG